MRKKRTKHYKKTKVDGVQMDVHRHKMEVHLGRKLDRFEIVNHKDEDIWNNDLSNLEVMTLADHTRLHLSNNSFGYRKLTNKDVIDIKRDFLKGFGLKELGEKFNVHYSTISHVVNLKNYASVDEDGLNERLTENKRPRQLAKYRKTA